MTKSKFYKRILFLLVVSFLLVIISSEIAEMQGLEWFVTSPSGWPNNAWSITADSNYIYIAGDDNSLGNNQWRIEKRRKSDGGLEWIQVINPTSGSDRAESITADDNYLYIAGHTNSPGNPAWRIEKRRKSDGGLEWAATFNSPGWDLARSITADSNYIYIAGDDESPGNVQWRIEKRRKSDGGIEWAEVFNPSSSYDFPTSITADSNYIYIAGVDTVLGNQQWRIEKRRKSNGGLEWAATFNPTPGNYDRPASITADSNYIYIAGYFGPPIGLPGDSQWRIEKRRKSDGGIEWAEAFNPSSSSDQARSITADDNYIYVAGYDESPAPGNDVQWRIEKRRKSDGGIEWIESSNPDPGPVNNIDRAYAITADNNYLYIAGIDQVGNLKIRIEKRRKTDYIDIGLRVYNGTEIVAIAAEQGVATSPLRIAKNGVVYGIVLINPGDPQYGNPIYDSGVRIQTSSGIKALRRYP